MKACTSHIPTPIKVVELVDQSRRCSSQVSPRTLPSTSADPAIRGEDYFSAERSGDHTKVEAESCEKRPSIKQASMGPMYSGHRRPSYLMNNYASVLPSLDPRPLGELENERLYLLSSLQKQNERATRLFKKYAAVEDRIAAAQHCGGETKKLNKELNSLRNKISESSHQEQLILLRLGEIYIETQNRDRWLQVHHFTGFPQLLPTLKYPPLRVATMYPETPTSADPISCLSSALSPLSPCFVPDAVHFSENIWDQKDATPQSKEKEKEEEEEEEEEEEKTEFKSVSEDVDEGIAVRSGDECLASENERADRNNDDANGNGDDNNDEGDGDRSEVEEVAWDFQGEDDDNLLHGESSSSPGPPQKKRLSSISVYTSLALKRDKRMSLPTLKFMWPKSRNNSMETAS
ncbi:hypothetical protein B0H63DRAFT_119500 [Podospora didyma]|uniref:Uncharacterized protein n=1 Tax=Podospora didyma TaxID=330526 RepID=A0AAE0U4J7_9PEZI|nr:hypothetical protein B0H63DRAFT_119500 [Podospora didyma]